jgi:hypothetical protein
MADRVSTVVDSGRTYDIDYVSWDSEVVGKAQFEFGMTSKKVYGLVKGVNRYLKLLLTRRGSDVFAPEEGTFLEDITHMGGESVSSLTSFTTIQLNDALSQVQVIQSQNVFPEDENISMVTLDNVDRVTSDEVIIKITVIPEAGSSTTIYVPILGG